MELSDGSKESFSVNAFNNNNNNNNQNNISIKMNNIGSYSNFYDDEHQSNSETLNQWTENDNDELLKLIKNFGMNWALVAKHFSKKNLTPRQCYQRYKIIMKKIYPENERNAVNVDVDSDVSFKEKPFKIPNDPIVLVQNIAEIEVENELSRMKLQQRIAIGTCGMFMPTDTVQCYHDMLKKICDREPNPVVIWIGLRPLSVPAEEFLNFKKIQTPLIPDCLELVNGWLTKNGYDLRQNQGILAKVVEFICIERCCKDKANYILSILHKDYCDQNEDVQ